LDDFVDYYELLQISPRAEFATIQRVHRMLAARYHPDNIESGNLEIFLVLEQAYKVLSDPERRSEYDARREVQESLPNPVFEAGEFVIGAEAEANRRLGVLCLLYNRRRTSPDQPSMSVLDVEARTALPREHLDFTIWYLREKSYIRRDEETNEFSITADGAEFVEKNATESRIVHKLLKPACRGHADTALTHHSDLHA
jgi:curved DNA-binding protein CbpA